MNWFQKLKKESSADILKQFLNGEINKDRAYTLLLRYPESCSTIMNFLQNNTINAQYPNVTNMLPVLVNMLDCEQINDNDSQLQDESQEIVDDATQID